MNREAIRSDYNAKRQWLEEIVMHDLGVLLKDARETFHRKYPNISPPKYPEVRTKLFAKIIEKLERKKRVWTHETVYVADENGKVETIVNDLVAGKLVCATLGDVDNVVEILNEWPRLSDIEGELVVNPRTGYRSYHIDARIEVFHIDRRLFFPVEIQIKTLLQDAWANFDHDELYKPTDEPPEVTKEISHHVADALYALDKIGQTIRNERLRQRPAPSEIGKEETLVTPHTLNYLANQIFETSMSDVELQKCVEQLKAFDYISIAATDALARDERVSTAIEVAKTQLRIPTEITPYEIFYFGPLAVKEGVEGVAAELRRVYALTDIPCDNCGGPISEEDKTFKETKTDLDEIYYCSLCRVHRLKKCSNCDKLTEAEVCKDCRSLDASIEII
jgi:ppGpp synthetase/RelA/SpoT-type nucleotidyltranferase